MLSIYVTSFLHYNVTPVIQTDVLAVHTDLHSSADELTFSA